MATSLPWRTHSAHTKMGFGQADQLCIPTQLYNNLVPAWASVEVWKVKYNIWEQELWSWVGKNEVGIGLDVLWVGNTSFYSTVQLSGAYPTYVEV